MNIKITITGVSQSDPNGAATLLNAAITVMANHFGPNGADAGLVEITAPPLGTVNIEVTAPASPT